MAMQVDDNNDNTQPSVILVENPSIDLEAYAASYTGLARVNRLLFIVDVCPSLRLEAVKIAISYVSNTYNVSLYQMLHRKLNELLAAQAANARDGPVAAAALPDVAMAVDGAAGGNNQDMPEFDPNWVEANMKNAALKLEKLDSDLKNYKTSSVKESIRRGLDDLGDHHTDCGDLANALKCYLRARDFCTSGKHVVYMCLNVIKISVLMQNWTQVISYVLKAESTPDYVDSSKDTYQVVQSYLKCAAGLAELQTKKYKEAAKHFLLAQFDHCNFPDFLTPNNVALYGGLCALATFDRSELQKNVIASASFKLFLEVEPQLRDVIVYFYASNYRQCLKLLDEMRDNLLLDMYLAAHVATLYTNIRKRALIQYLSPYQTADMHRMAEAFNCPVVALENELVELILDDQIEARIDSHQKVVHAKETDERSMTFQRALQVGRDFERSARLMVLRAAMIKNQLYVKKEDTTEPIAMDACDAASTGNTQRN